MRLPRTSAGNTHCLINVVPLLCFSSISSSIGCFPLWRFVSCDYFFPSTLWEAAIAIWRMVNFEAWCERENQAADICFKAVCHPLQHWLTRSVWASLDCNNSHGEFNFSVVSWQIIHQEWSNESIICYHDTIEKFQFTNLHHRSLVRGR